MLEIGTIIFVNRNKYFIELLFMSKLFVLVESYFSHFAKVCFRKTLKNCLLIPVYEADKSDKSFLSKKG